VEMGEHPQTVGYSLTDSPVGLAAWMLDHDADSYQKISHAFVDGEPVGGLTRDRILDNITLYWLTGTATSAAGLYWEETQSIAAAAGSGQAPPKLSLPVAFTVFPSEIVQAPRGWAEKVYPNLIYFHEAAKGGHFAAWEEPEVFSQELRAAFKTLR
jgi:pimeloyl-ACP methyl ester carboxylesterase